MANFHREHPKSSFVVYPINNLVLKDTFSTVQTIQKIFNNVYTVYHIKDRLYDYSFSGVLINAWLEKFLFHPLHVCYFFANLKTI